MCLNDPELLQEFVIESQEHLASVESQLLALEGCEGAVDTSSVNNVFRAVHSIKGAAGFLGLSTLETLAHRGEEVLNRLRNNEIRPTNEVINTLLRATDKLKELLDSIETSNGQDISVNVKALEQLMNVTTDAAPITNLIQTSLDKDRIEDPKLCMSETPPAAMASPNTPDVSNNHSASDSTIRVDVALLDKLMTRVGELVLARNQILQFTNQLGDSDLISTSQRLNLITTELQEGVMKTRMQQIGNVWAKFPRMVRDLAAICGKEVRIEMVGKETELDKTIIEAIKDPLTHLVRNTVDHGIEKPSVRTENGKPAEGCLSLRAFHEGGQVNIEISDDGAGLNFERIKSKALEKGLITSEQAGRLQDREIGQLIFLPGFSTAEKVSNVSGRGVGMDVVKTNIEKIGGVVDLQSTPGLGTTIRIKIPLTLAIIPALVISNDGSRFAIPQVSLLELVRLEGENAQESIEWIQGAPVYRLRGRLLPLVYLGDVLKTRREKSDAVEAFNIVVLRADDRQFGLVVDRINDTEEIVVKPLGMQLKGVNVYSGATIMGDGKVALILDVLGLAHGSNVVAKDRTRSVSDSSPKSKDPTGLCQTLLILGTGSNRRMALPISQVARLEQISCDSVEYADNQEVVQYRGEILPLIRLASVLGLEDNYTNTDGLLNVVVYIEANRSFGLVVNQIIDIIETSVELSGASNRIGLLGAAIIQEHVTDLVDLPAIIGQFDGASHS